LGRGRLDKTVTSFQNLILQRNEVFANSKSRTFLPTT
jgi:hypothetical protein